MADPVRCARVGMWTNNDVEWMCGGRVDAPTPDRQIRFRLERAGRRQ